MSSTLRATTSQPRSLLSIAKLNMARSRVRPSTINRVLIDQTCFGRSGGLAPISLPLFQGVWLGAVDRLGPTPRLVRTGSMAGNTGCGFMSGFRVLRSYADQGRDAVGRS